MKNTKTKHPLTFPAKPTKRTAPRKDLGDLFLPRNRAAREWVLAQEREASKASA